MKTLLMIDDDEKLVQLVQEYLEPNGYRVHGAHEGHEGLSMVRRIGPELVILDIMLPGIDGFEVCSRIRAFSQVPVLMLTAKGEETDRIVGLEMGADDYLPKPFNPRELLARIRAILRRVAASSDRESPRRFEVGTLVLDLGSRTVYLRDRSVELTTAEFDLLHALIAAAGQVLSREQLMQQLHATAWASYDRSIDVHISRIRHKIEDDPKRPKLLKTVRGVGYQFVLPESGP